jgi:NAD(P)-dependent dehydrogenase (short-subunit alcohol dehydrogenase family)
MADKKVWFITGAGRGMGVDIAQAALSAGRAVVATGRSTEAVADAVGEADDLLVVELDITSLASAEAAVQVAVGRFGRIDILVNNAGNFAGFFEELPNTERSRRRIFGLMNHRASCPSCAAVRERLSLLDRGDAGVLLRLRRFEVRPGGMDGVAAVRDRAVRHPNHDR